MTSLHLGTVATILACAACSNSPTQPDASTEGGADVAAQDVIYQNDTAPPGDAGYDGPTVNPVCAARDAGTGTGSCVPIAPDAGFVCDPLTNAQCNADAGEACDFGKVGFQCYAPPPSNTAALCAMCDDTVGPACAPSSTCVPTAQGNTCAQFCCVDGDCASGHCDKTTLQTDPVGICVN